MSLDTLRKRHPRFTYRSYAIEEIPSASLGEDAGTATGSALRVRYDFLLEPDIVFTPEISFPIAKDVDVHSLEELVFQLGLVEMISYWKCACAPEILISAAPMQSESLSWWKDLFLHGLGEFYWQNKIDFAQPKFFNILCKEKRDSANLFHSAEKERELIMVGGGKDSSLTLELLSSGSESSRVMALNPTRSSLDSARIAGYSRPVIVNRRIDPVLLDLNTKGYLNGHTPFSAYLAFLSTLVAAANGFTRVIASNETSAEEANLTISGMPINHQYSKSFRFERLFRNYAKKYLSEDIQYYSILRPLHDVQISMLFSRFERQLRSFRSCNINQRKDSWCGTCPKCAFVFLTIAPFLSKEKMLEVFSTNYFLDSAIQKHIQDLLGEGEGKPFECVGTIEESRLALRLAIQNATNGGIKVPEELQRLVEQSEETNAGESLLHSWSTDHFLPLHQEALLKNALKESLDAIGA